MVAKHVLVVGATRILRPAALALASAGHCVHALARTKSDLDDLAATDPDHLVALPADYTDEPAFAATLLGQTFDHAMAYCPDIPSGSMSALRTSVTGTSVRVLTSTAARPAVSGDEPFDLSRLSPSRQPWHRLLLGWTSGAPHRWHTPEEISAAALEVFRTEEDQLLGVVRPWGDRPS